MSKVINKYSILVVLFLMSTLFWFMIFNVSSSLQPSGTELDTLSGTTINHEGRKSSENPNPNLPYFAGFDLLLDAGVSADDMNYIQDVLINFTLYNKHLKSAKISYIKDSFNSDISKSLDDVYSFKFGINNDNIHIMKVVSNSINHQIKITINDGLNKKVFERQFFIYSN